MPYQVISGTARVCIRNLFTDPESLDAKNSPWRGFTTQDIQARRLYLANDLMPSLQASEDSLQTMCIKFAREWRGDPSLRILDNVKAVFGSMLAALKAMRSAFAISVANAPFYIGLRTELARYKPAIDTTTRQLDRLHDHYYGSPWFESDGMSLQALRRGLMESNDIEKDERDPLVSLQADHGLPSSNGTCRIIANSLAHRGSLWILRARRSRLLFSGMIVVLFSIIVALIWSVTRKDPQTGFAVGGFILTAGTAIIAILRKRSRAENTTDAAGRPGLHSQIRLLGR